MQPLFTATYTGYPDIGDALFLVTAASNSKSCYLKYNVQAASFAVISSDGTYWQSLAPGSQSSIGNDKCVLHGLGTSATSNGNTLTVSFALDFNPPNVSPPPLLGQNTTSLFAFNAAGTSGSGWYQKGTWNVATTADPPTPSVTPSGAMASTQTFSFTAQSYGGASNISTMLLLFGDDEVDGYGACYIQYIPGVNAIYMTDDKGTYWQGGYAPTSINTISNSQCSIDVSQTSFSIGYDTVTISPRITFSNTFVGPLGVYMYIYDQQGQVSNWWRVGTWTAYSAQPGLPTRSITPSSGAGMKPLLSFHTSDANGYTYIPREQLLIAQTVTGTGTCSMFYRRVPNQLYLQSDDGFTWLGPLNPGSSGTLGNQQCSIDLQQSSWTASGPDLYVNLAITFGSGYTGTKSTWIYPVDHGGEVLDWSPPVGTWNVAALADPPTPSVTPSNESGSTQTFSFTAQSYGGAANLSTMYLLFADDEADGFGACYMQYLPGVNAIYLTDDQAAHWLGGYAPMSANTISNSQCTIDVSQTHVSMGYDTITIAPKITFKNGFIGPLGMYMYIYDQQGHVSNWWRIGTWTAFPASPQLPTRDVAPVSGTGLGAVFRFHTGDVNGYTYISREQLLIAPTVNGTGTCSMFYRRVPNQLSLQSDDGFTWLGPVNLGTQGTLQNLQCKIDLAQSSWQGYGADLYVNLAITFLNSYGGLKSTWMYPWDHAGQVLGWTPPVGAWTIGPAPVPKITTTSPLPTATTGQPYHVSISATGGTLPYRWSVVGPSGFGIQNTTDPYTATFGTNSVPIPPPGTPSYTFSVAVQDSSYPTPQAMSNNLTIPLSSTTPGLAITTSSALPRGIAGSAFYQILSANGGIPPYTWRLVGGTLPPGLGLGQQSGVISGTPTSAGSYSFTVQVSDSTGQSFPTTFSLAIASIPLTIMTNSVLPTGTKGAGYPLTFTAAGGAGGYGNWTVSAGALPTGLVLDANSGLLSGSPTATGNYAFDLSVSDAGSHTTTKHFNVAIVVSSQEFIRLGGRVIAVENTP